MLRQATELSNVASGDPLVDPHTFARGQALVLRGRKPGYWSDGCGELLHVLPR